MRTASASMAMALQLKQLFQRGQVSFAVGLEALHEDIVGLLQLAFLFQRDDRIARRHVALARVADLVENLLFLCVVSSASTCFCSPLTSREEFAVSSAKNAPSDMSLLFEIAVVRRTLVWISRYQSPTMRSFASGCCIMSWLASATEIIHDLEAGVIRGAGAVRLNIVARKNYKFTTVNETWCAAACLAVWRMVALTQLGLQ
jgi:hypothetical protein